MEPPVDLASKTPSRMSRTSRMSRMSRGAPLPKFEFSNFTNYPDQAPWHPSPSILTTGTDSSAPSSRENVTDKSMTTLSRVKFRLIIILVVMVALTCFGLVGVAIKLALKRPPSAYTQTDPYTGKYSYK
ncbi:hypothetical protein LSAT2_010585 [Lamellibrachia satsuma]|nr:hypothetical protein LSAT2_010585 [Lamellibrachia satsuma]